MAVFKPKLPTKVSTTDDSDPDAGLPPIGFTLTAQQEAAKEQQQQRQAILQQVAQEGEEVPSTAPKAVPIPRPPLAAPIRAGLPEKLTIQKVTAPPAVVTAPPARIWVSGYSPAELERVSAQTGLTAAALDVIASIPESIRTPGQQRVWEQVRDQLAPSVAIEPERPKRGLLERLQERREEAEAAARGSIVSTEEREEAVSKAAEKVGISEKVATRLLASTAATLTSAQQRTKQLLQQALGEVPTERGISGAVADVMKEALTFGKAETETLNRDDLGVRYEQARQDVTAEFQRAKAEAEAEGKIVSETAEGYIDRVLPSKDEFVQEVLDAQPQLSTLAKEVGIASIPVVGTVKYWEGAPGWAQALSIAGDLAVVLPVIGQAAAASRAGAGFLRTAANITIAEIKAPYTTIRHPIRTIKGALEPLETLLDPRKIPVEVLEVRTHTQKLPFAEEALGGPHTINMPTEIMTREEILKIRETLTQAAIRGEPAYVSLSGVGDIELATPGLQRVTSMAAVVTNSPDLRNWYPGLVVGEKITDAQGNIMQGGRMFLAPGRMERFVQSTASGLTELGLSDKAAAAVRLGDIPDQPIKGSVIIRDPEVLSKLQDSNKLWQKAAEIETTLDVDTVIPPPSQVLYTRGPTGEATRILVIGKPFTPAEIAKLKLAGPAEAVKSIFSPGPGRFTAYSDDITKASQTARQSADLYDQAQAAKIAGRLDEAADLERQADNLLIRADSDFARAAARSGMTDASVSAVSVYTGDQDISGALRATGEPPPRARRGEDIIGRRSEVDRLPSTEAAEIRIGDTELDRVRVPDDLDRRISPPEEPDRRPPPPSDERRIPPPPSDERRIPPPGERRRPPGEPPRIAPPPPPPRVPPPPPSVITPRPPEVARAARLRLPGGPPSRPSSEELRARAPGLAWKQGNIWIALYPPYTEQDILLQPMYQPVNTVKVKGPKQAWDRIRKTGYEIESDTYDEWAAWFTASEALGLDVQIAVPATGVAEEAGIPISFKREYWWSS